MKKLISLILAVLMIGLYACGIAEETEGSEGTSFLRIREGVTAQVFKEPGGEEAVDTLEGGRICGLLDEGVSAAGAAWFQVFYLNSKKEGAVGYINAEDAEKLTADQLKALMEDPAMLNEILDLIDALDAFLGTANGDTENGGGTSLNKMQSLYKQAMDKLKKVFSTDVSSELGSLEEKGKELADKAKEAGEDLLDKAKEAGGNLKDSLTDALSSVKGKDIGETLENLKDSISDAIGGKDGESGKKIDEIMDKVSHGLSLLDNIAGNGAGNTIDGLSNIVNNAKDWLNGPDFSKVNDAMNNLAETFKTDGFSKGTGTEGIGSFIDELKSIFSSK